MRMRRILLGALTMVAACNGGGGGDGGDDGSGSSGDEAGIHVETLDPVARLVRISMTLRGIRPSLAEIAAVEADPAAIDSIVDDYLASAQFGATMRELHNESLLVLSDYFIYPAGFLPHEPIAGQDIYRTNRDVMEAPLRLIEHVVTNDRPYSEIVTADYTLANGTVAAIWGLPYDGDGAQWVETQWQDGRGNAGILADSWLWQRHSSTLSNANRGRANALSRALLCYDFLSRDIEVDASIDLADPEAVANAVVHNPACASCHQALDPLASFFSGFYPVYVPGSPDNNPWMDVYPFTPWYPHLFTELLGVPMRDPSYFGTVGSDLPALGELVAADPRFSLCTAKRFYAYFHQIELDDVPLEIEAELQQVFTDSGMNAKALARAIVLADDFAVSHVVLPETVAPDELAPEDDVVGVKKARPMQLARTIEDLTGFRWTTDLSILAGPELPYGLGRVELMEDSFLGYQVLAGGLDSIYVTRSSHTYSATVSLTLRMLAQNAADDAVEADFAVEAGARRLLGLVEPTTTDEAAVRAQLVALWLRLYGVRVDADAPEIADGWTLWSGALAHAGDARRAWKVTLTAMLQDLRIAYY
jgi:hypothetical protein